MELQAEFFRYVTDMRGEGDTVLMARIALNLGHDASAYPVDLSDIARIGRGGRSPASCGINELWMIQFIQAALLRRVRPWSGLEVEQLFLLKGVRETVEESHAKAKKKRAKSKKE